MLRPAHDNQGTTDLGGLAPPRPLEGPADLLLVNARVFTLDRYRPWAEAVAVRAGRILALGSQAELQALVGPATTIVDAQGDLAVPAFHDAHLHLLSYARAQSKLDCHTMRSIGEISAALAARAPAAAGHLGARHGLRRDTARGGPPPRPSRPRRGRAPPSGPPPAP